MNVVVEGCGQAGRFEGQREIGRRERHTVRREPARKGMPVHAHHPVYPRSHGQWSRVARFTQWLRVEIAAEV